MPSKTHIEQPPKITIRDAISTKSKIHHKSYLGSCNYFVILQNYTPVFFQLCTMKMFPIGLEGDN